MNELHIHSHKTKAFRVGVVCGLTVAGIGFGIFGFTKVYATKIYPFISIQGVSVGGLTKVQAVEKIKSVYPDSRDVTFSASDKPIIGSAHDLGYTINYTTAVNTAFSIGRGGEFTRSIALTANAPRVNVLAVLVKENPNLVTKPVDASFTLTDGVLTTVAQKDGTNLSISAIAHSIETQLVQKESIVVPVISQPTHALITDSILNALKPDVQKYLDTELSVAIGKKTYIPTVQDRFSFLNFQIRDGLPTIAPNDEAIKTYVAKLDIDTSYAPKPDVYYTTGELSSEGVDGRSIDQEKAAYQLSQAFGSHDTSRITLATTVVPRSKKIIEAEYTPGLYGGKYIEVDLSSQTLYQFEGETMVGKHSVSTGKWSTPTPIGTYTINNKDPRAYSSTYDLYMPYWMAFIGSKYGIHELPEWANGSKEGANHIGTPVSHGCIRLGVGDAGEVYDWTEIGTTVVIHR